MGIPLGIPFLRSVWIWLLLEEKEFFEGVRTNVIGGPGYQVARPPFVVRRTVRLSGCRGPPRSPEMPKADGGTRRPVANFNMRSPSYQDRS